MSAKAAKAWRITGFYGMNNLLKSPSEIQDRFGRAWPALVVNADVLDGYCLKQRGGQSKFIPLPGAHSLWAGGVMLCADAASLYRVDGTTLINLADLPGPPERITYLELNDAVYWSNRWNNGAFDLLAGQMRPWGVALPPAPRVSLIDGDLVSGQYSLCFTNTRGETQGGNGPITQISWEGTKKGVAISNLPEGALCWFTHVDGGDQLFLAQLEPWGDGGWAVVRQNPWVQPLPTLLEKPPPPFCHFQYSFGRIWGCNEKRLYYSQPYRIENFSHFFPFEEEVIMVAPVTDGLFVNSRRSTWFLDSGDPTKAIKRRVGDGAVPGTLIYAMRRTPDTAGTHHPIESPEPLWVTPAGVVAGTNNGRILHLTDTRLKMDALSDGAALYRMVDGRPQAIFSLYGTPRSAPDAVLSNLMSYGKLIS